MGTLLVDIRVFADKSAKWNRGIWIRGQNIPVRIEYGYGCVADCAKVLNQCEKFIVSIGFHGTNPPSIVNVEKC